MDPTLYLYVAASAALAAATGVLYLKPELRARIVQHFRSPGFQRRLPVYLALLRKLVTRRS